MKLLLKLKTVLLGIALIGYCPAPWATGECDKYLTPYDKTYCYAKLFLESDKELNDTYKKLRSVVKESTKTSLTQVQRDWISYRDEHCQPRQGQINVDCNYTVNRERTQYLNDRFRECKVGTCRDDMISSKSWN